MGLLFPTEGDLLINSQKNVQKDQINSLFTYIPQRPFIFEDTLKNNIEFNFNNPENLNNVKNISKLDKLNLDKFLEKDGINLSGGQVQRVALARSLYFFRDIYIFDEFTSALDDETEKEILVEVNNLLAKKTSIIISHNLNVLKKLCKRVYKIEKSEIIKVEI
jgi:ABC-type transport system involved in cytochrome bd biosynthesis fused ATPase/permease subunit